MHRLETLSQPLMVVLRRLDRAGLRAACLQACQRSFRQVSPVGPATAAAMVRLARNEALSPPERDALEREVQAADDAYLEAQDADDPSAGTESLAQFTLARLGSALLLVDSAIAADPAADCIYEALSALPVPRAAAQALLLTLS